MADLSTENGLNIEEPTSGQSPQMMACGAAIGAGQMERFVQSFQQSTQRWEIIVYPALFAFIVLAAYGFFLIYNLTGNMSTIARSMDPNMGEHMEQMADSVIKLSEQISIMTTKMHEVSEKLDTLSPMLQHIKYIEQSITTSLPPMVQRISSMERSIANSLPPMVKHMGDMEKSIVSNLPQMAERMTYMEKSIAQMDKSMRVMKTNTEKMQVELMVLNESVSRPMSFMNKFAPW